MASTLPFQRTGLLISEIEEFLDKVSEAALVLETTVLHYADKGPDAQLEERLQQMRAIEARSDELRRSIANSMYVQMLMPDTRGDILTLLDEVDIVVDDCAHIIVALVVERPEVPSEFREGFRKIVTEVSKSGRTMTDGARAYFKDPKAVRNHVHEIGFHEDEATNAVLQLGRQIFDSDLPLEHKRQLGDWILRLRKIASHAHDVGDCTTIFAVKRAY